MANSKAIAPVLTIVADSNIAQLDSYFCSSVLGVAVNVIAIAGRDIDAALLAKHQPRALLVRSVTQVNSDLLAANTSVKFVGSATIGTDHIDQDYLHSHHISFANAAGCSKHSVAQYVITAILKLLPKKVFSNILSPSFKLGIIGLGNIGSTLATYANDLGWQVLGYDPFLPASAINNASLKQVLTQSQAISLHVPLTTKLQSQWPTYHLIDSNALAMMAEDALLINTARGPVVSEQDLLEAFGTKSTSKRSVVLDVFEHEPIVSAELLSQLDIATPHIAGYTLEGKLRGTQMIFDAFVAVFSEYINVQHTQLLDSLLPPNPFSWQDLHANLQKLDTFYDIMADNALLHNTINNESNHVFGADFDRLRKQYALRREWHYLS